MMDCTESGNDPHGCFTVDVEDWFHILDTPQTPPLEKWGQMESRVAANLDRILELLSEKQCHATLFWLGWVAERHPELLLRCHKLGHEIASHGYGHLLPYVVGRKRFCDDISRGKNTLEDIIGEPVLGFRAPGFGITKDAPWAFDEIRQAGYHYDSSVFPTARGHGGISKAPLNPYVIDTPSGPLAEIPMSMIQIFGMRIPMFGGGYLRLMPQWCINWGVHDLIRHGRPLVIYIHPREIDTNHPHLTLTPVRRFKSYINLKSTKPKIQFLLNRCRFARMRDMVPDILQNNS